MLKKSYILNFIIDAKFNIYKIKYLLFLSWDWEVWCLTQSGGGVITPPPKETLLEIRGGNVFTA
jgi:hypothetical protein